MAEPEREEQTNYTQADASGKSVAQDMFQSQTQQLPPQQQQQQQSQSQSQAQQATGPLLPPIQQTSGQPAQPAQPVPGHDQSQGSMQASSPQQAYAMHQQQQQQQQQQHQQQQQQQQQHHPPPQQQPQYAHAQPPAPPQQQQSQPPPPPGHAQSPIVTPQQQYAQSPQQQYAQSPQQHYEQPPPQHYEQPPPQAHYAQPAPTQQQQPPQVQYELPPPPQANGAPPGYAPAQQHIPPHHSAYQYQQQQQQQQQPPPPQQPQYQPPLVNGDANAYPPQMRYPMPLPAGQMNAQQLSGTRHKKEIKRRTKTGCLTCRKRRIKCDEGHPSCRNCQKSKRECLGYDPIFKAQTGQPANIQPQPGSVPPPPASHSPHLPPPPAHAHAQYSNVPQGYAPASSAGYAPASVIQNQLEQAAYEYGGAIDPALAAAHPPPSHAPPPMPPAQEEYTTILLPERKVRLIAMDDVFSLDAIQPTFPAPRDPNSPMPQQDIDPIRDLYLREYAPGLDRFFETDWYSAAGLHILLASPDLLHYFAHCLHRFHIPPSESNKGLPSIEARLVWLLASMAFSPQASANNAPPLPFIPRIEAVSHLILGTFMQPESVPPAPAHMPDMKTQPEAYAFYLQDLFWHHLASLATVHDDVASPAAANDIASHLAGMRNILSMLENRDVLYSMAIARHFGGRMERFEPDKLLVGRGGEAEDPINKLAVAMSFLANEEVGGTTQVVQRVCGMGRRGFALQRLDFGMPSQNELKNEDYHDSVDCSDMSFEQHQSQHQHHQQEQPQHHVQPHENGNGEAKFEPAAAQQI